MFAEKSEIQGIVRSNVYIDKDGTIAGVKIQSTPHPSLGKAAIKTFLKIARFDTPPMANGDSIRTVMHIPVVFRLRE
jgi:TonB family protein